MPSSSRAILLDGSLVVAQRLNALDAHGVVLAELLDADEGFIEFALHVGHLIGARLPGEGNGHQRQRAHHRADQTAAPKPGVRFPGRAESRHIAMLRTRARGSKFLSPFRCDGGFTPRSSVGRCRLSPP